MTLFQIKTSDILTGALTGIFAGIFTGISTGILTNPNLMYTCFKSVKSVT